MLPFDAEDEQHLDRKRHIGNDVTVVIFLGPMKLRTYCYLNSSR